MTTKPAILGRSLAPTVAPVTHVIIRFQWLKDAILTMPSIYKLSHGDVHLVVHGAN